jgi:hypothetical protein
MAARQIATPVWKAKVMQELGDLFMQSGIVSTWAEVEFPHANIGAGDSIAVMNAALPYLGDLADDRCEVAADALEDFDDDDFDDEFDDDFEEEWDEELPGDADQFEPDEKEASDDAVEVEPDFEDED